MLYGGGIVGLVLLGFWIWAIFDVITTDESLCRNLPKVLWLMLVIFLSSIGAIAWLLLGRPENASFRIGDSSPRPPPRRALGPEDSDHWGPLPLERGPDDYAELDAELDRRIEEKLKRERELAAWEDDLRRREAELSPDDRSDPPPPTPF